MTPQEEIEIKSEFDAWCTAYGLYGSSELWFAFKSGAMAMLETFETGRKSGHEPPQ